MGKAAQEVLTQKGVNIKELVAKLNEAYADEWMSYLQYWAGAQVVQGPMRPSVQKEFMDHAEEELKHAKLLVDRIIELGGAPNPDAQDWFKSATCKYIKPDNIDVHVLLKQNLDGERCVIKVYNDILEYARKAGDAVTFHIIRHIVQEEMDHEQDLEDYLADIAHLK